MARARLLPLLALLVLTPAVAGCGGGAHKRADPTLGGRYPKAGGRPGGRSDAATRALAAAGRRTAAAGTAGVAMTLTLPPPEAATGSGAGVVDFRRDRTSIALSIETHGRTANATVFLSGGRQYVRVEPDGRWRLGSVGPNFRITSLSAVGVLGRVLTGVRRAGSARVRGARCARYRAQIDLDRAALQVPAAQRSAYRASLRLFKRRRIPTELYVGRDGRICRQRVALSARELGAGIQGRLEVDYDLYGYGRPPSPPVPQVGSR